MPNAYENANYAGVLSESVSDTLLRIKNFALANGWTLHSGDFDSLPMVLRSGFSVDGIYAFYRFTSPSATVISIQGDIGGSGTSLSPGANTNNQLQDIAAGSRLFLAAKDNQAMTIYSKPPSADGAVQLLGWPDLINPLDSYAWGLWELDNFVTAASTTTRNKTIARAFGTTNEWQSAPTTTTSHATQDFWAYNVATGSNSVFLSPVAGSFPVMFKFPVADSTGLVRGFLPLVANGMMGMSAGSVLKQPGSEVRYMATGALQHALQVSG